MQCVGSCKSGNVSIISPPYAKYTHQRQKKDDKVENMAGRTRYQSSQQKSMLMGSINDMAKNGDFINPEEFLHADADTRLLTLITSINKLHNRFDSLEQGLSGDDGFCARLEKVEGEVEEISSRENTVISEVNMLKGIVQRQEQQISSLSHQVVDLQARLMAENLLISGLIEFESEEGLSQSGPKFSPTSRGSRG